jgi:guanine nucleotide-binding protein subunit gamma
MSSPYEIRSNDNGKSKKQSMAELKLRRLTELNQRLQEDLNRRRIPVSEAALECVFRCCRQHMSTLSYTCGTPC